ncbi:hypothetical protein DFJ73DRAFT_843739 [Zopfochytrium polystomum]|nr:hypothetical protein DFJ73DRAFT_843739 [Zopfochytrium polystomum]
MSLKEREALRVRSGQGGREGTNKTNGWDRANDETERRGLRCDPEDSDRSFSRFRFPIHSQPKPMLRRRRLVRMLLLLLRRRLDRRVPRPGPGRHLGRRNAGGRRSSRGLLLPVLRAVRHPRAGRPHIDLGHLATARPEAGATQRRRRLVVAVRGPADLVHERRGPRDGRALLGKRQLRASAAAEGRRLWVASGVRRRVPRTGCGGLDLGRLDGRGGGAEGRLCGGVLCVVGHAGAGVADVDGVGVGGGGVDGGALVGDGGLEGRGGVTAAADLVDGAGGGGAAAAEDVGKGGRAGSCAEGGGFGVSTAEHLFFVVCVGEGVCE